MRRCYPPHQMLAGADSDALIHFDSVVIASKPAPQRPYASRADTDQPQQSGQGLTRTGFSAWAISTDHFSLSSSPAI